MIRMGGSHKLSHNVLLDFLMWPTLEILFKYYDWSFEKGWPQSQEVFRFVSRVYEPATKKGQQKFKKVILKFIR